MSVVLSIICLALAAYVAFGLIFIRRFTKQVNDLRLKAIDDHEYAKIMREDYGISVHECRTKRPIELAAIIVVEVEKEGATYG